MATPQTATPTAAKKLGRRTLRKVGRTKRKLKLQSDKEFAGKYFAAKSKRSTDKKVAYRKRNSKK